MPTVIKGTSGLFETVGSSVKIGNFKNKEAEGATVQFADVDAFGGKNYLKSGAHKYGEFKSATSTYQNGMASGEAIYENKSEDIVYTLNIGTTSEPIDAHPNFRVKIGGDANEPKHQAEFDQDNAFRKFPLKYLKSQGDMLPVDAYKRLT